MAAYTFSNGDQRTAIRAGLNGNAALIDLNAPKASPTFTGVLASPAHANIDTEIALKATNLRSVEANTAGVGSPNILTAAESSKILTNEGATAENYHTLPTAAAGLQYTFFCDDTDGIRITANTGDTIRMESAVSASAGYINSTIIGAHVTLIAINATQWLALADDAVDWFMDGVRVGPGSHGEYYFSTPAATTLSAATPAKAAGTTTALKSIGFTHSDNKLIYTGLAPHDFMITASISMTKTSGGSTLGSVHIALNGTVVTGLELRSSFANTSDEKAMTLIGTISLTTSDYVEIFIETVDGDNLTVETGVITIEDAGPSS